MLERIYHCDGPDCDATTHTFRRIPESSGWLYITWSAGRKGDGNPKKPLTRVFCSWDCVLRFAARFEPTDDYLSPSEET